MKKKYYNLSYGGGVNSSALYFYIVHEKKMPLNSVIFSDTGEESKETYNAVKRLQEQCKKDNINFIIVKSPYGRLVDYYTKKKAIPSIMKRDCTSKFKISPIRKYLTTLKKEYDIVQYIGIAYDEIHRMTTSNVKYITYSYPFCDDKITRKGNEEILEKYNFKAQKSGCMGCPYQSKSSWRNLYKNHYEEFKRWQNMEENNIHYERRSNPLYLTGSYSLKQIENFMKYQKSLDNWTNKQEEDLTCPNTAGGCFL